MTLFFSECNIPQTPAVAPENTKNPSSTSVLESSQQQMCQQKFLDHQNQKNPSPLSSDELSPPLNQQSPNQIMVSEIRPFQKKNLLTPA